ncbi:hypothetical protein GGI12_003269 [Dipsacomyces acuminosporus]|nr:hypothetical protein GGI12_003269 [Dipsacomyces acuminosporus]
MKLFLVVLAALASSAYSVHGGIIPDPAPTTLSLQSTKASPIYDAAEPDSSGTPGDGVTIRVESASRYIPGWPSLITAVTGEKVIYYPDSSVTTSSFNAANMLCQVNIIRMSRGLYPVVYHERLMKLAQGHSRFQSRYKVVTHADSGGPIGDRMNALGFEWRLLLENVGAGASNENGIVDAWKRSPGHLANMLNPDARYMGVDVNKGFWVQDFAAPKNKNYVIPLYKINPCPSPNRLLIYS